MHKSSRHFSPILIDQAHKQAKAVIKADGGAIGVTRDCATLKRLMVAGPEVRCLIRSRRQFAQQNKILSPPCSHHEHTERSQKMSLEKVQKLFQALTDMGSPFYEESKDVITLILRTVYHTNQYTFEERHVMFPGFHEGTG